jgi:hypothetical protein
MLVSHRIGIPTINGHSGWSPVRWHLLHPEAPDYLDRVAAWLERYGITEQTCALDREHRRWLDARSVFARDQLAASVPRAHHRDPAVYRIGEAVKFSIGGTSEAYAGKGWSLPEAWGRWTDGPVARLDLLLEPALPADLELSARILPYTQKSHPIQRVVVVVNGETVDQWTFLFGEKTATRHAGVPARVAALRTPVQVQFLLPDAIAPERLGLSEDDRRLGIGVIELSIDAASSPPATR